MTYPSIDSDLESRAKDDETLIMLVWSKYQPAINAALAKAGMERSAGAVGSTEGFPAFLVAFRAWDPEKGAFASYLKRRLSGLLEQQKAGEAFTQPPREQARKDWGLQIAQPLSHEMLSLLPGTETPSLDDLAFRDNDAEPNMGMALKLERELAKLPDSDRELMLAAATGITLAELAELGGVTYQAIQQRIEAITDRVVSGLQGRVNDEAQDEAWLRWINDPDGTSALHAVIAAYDTTKPDADGFKVVKQPKPWTNEDATNLLILATLYGELTDLDWAESA